MHYSKVYVINICVMYCLDKEIRRRITIKLTYCCCSQTLGNNNRRSTAGVERSGGIFCKAQSDDGEGGRLQHHDSGPGVKVG